MIPACDPHAELLAEYRRKRGAIHRRLREFSALSKKDDPAIFHELCFAILAANSSSEMADKTLQAIADLVMDGSVEAMQARLRGRFRFWRRRPDYIVHTRTSLRACCGLRLWSFFRSFPSNQALRAYLAETKMIKGVGYKEASHFLRNIGVRGLAILDKHILACLVEFGVVRSAKPPKNRREYLRLERKMQAFASRLQISVDALDLLLWSRRTGKILR